MTMMTIMTMMTMMTLMIVIMTIQALTSSQGWTWTQKAPPRGSCLTLSPGDDIDDDKDHDDDGDGGDHDDNEEDYNDVMQPKECFHLRNQEIAHHELSC